MTNVRHSWLVCIVLASTTALVSCGRPDSERILPAPIERIDRSLLAAASYLIDQQSPDGVWRPDTYGAFKDGASLTPLVLQALLATPGSERIDSAIRKGTQYLAKMVQADGTIDAGPRGLSYPVYTAANAVIVLSNPRNGGYQRERDAWLMYLRARQLTEVLGWQTSDKPYGGWGYSSGLPRKPSPGETAPALTESNLSATVFALTALRSVSVAESDPALEKALVFVKRCQNYCADPKLRDPVFDDGGFFFIYDDSVRNKAGVAGKDSAGRERYASYGSTTADGLRALLACGLSATDDRVVAARSWLETNFDPAGHPGRYANERLADRPALHFYYACSLAQALQALKPMVSWEAPLADEILKSQQPDGRWVNATRAVREDEPVLATSFAVIALAICRERVSASSDQAVGRK